MTRLTANERCATCQGLLVPPEAAYLPVPPNTDYVCLQCGRPYRWLGDPPRLTAIVPERPREDDPR